MATRLDKINELRKKQQEEEKKKKAAVLKTTTAESGKKSTAGSGKKSTVGTTSISERIKAGIEQNTQLRSRLNTARKKEERYQEGTLSYDEYNNYINRLNSNVRTANPSTAVTGRRTNPKMTVTVPTGAVKPVTVGGKTTTIGNGKITAGTGKEKMFGTSQAATGTPEIKTGKHWIPEIEKLPNYKPGTATIEKLPDYNPGTRKLVPLTGKTGAATGTGKTGTGTGSGAGLPEYKPVGPATTAAGTRTAAGSGLSEAHLGGSRAAAGPAEEYEPEKTPEEKERQAAGLKSIGEAWDETVRNLIGLTGEIGKGTPPAQGTAQAAQGTAQAVGKNTGTAQLPESGTEGETEQKKTNPYSLNGMSYKDWSLYNQLLTPGTKVNEINRIRFGDGVKMSRDMKEDGTWEDWTAQNSRDYLDWQNSARDYGFLDDSDDYRDWSTGKLKNELRKEQEKAKVNVPDDSQRMGNLEQLYGVHAQATGVKHPGYTDDYRDTAGLEAGLPVYDENGNLIASITGKPEDYGRNEEITVRADAAVYDMIHQDPGAYMRLYNQVFDDTVESGAALWEAMEEVDRAWNAIGKSGTPEEAFRNLFGYDMGEMRSVVQDQNITRSTEMNNAVKYQKQLENLELVRKYEEGAKQYTDGTYHDELNKTQIGFNTEGEYYLKGGSDLDQAYYRINHPFFETDDGNGNRYEHPQLAHELYFLTGDQIDTFNKYYNAGDTEGAKGYLEGIWGDLQRARAEWISYFDKQRASRNDLLGYATGAGTWFRQLAAGPMGTYGALAALWGDQDAANPDSRIYDQVRSVQDIRGTRGVKWAQGVQDLWEWATGEKDSKLAARVGQFLNQSIYSMGDNAMAVLFGTTLGGGGAAKASQVLTQLIMSSGAAASEMYEGLKNGRSPAEAAVLSIASGVIEAATEKYSIEALLSDPTSAGAFFLKNTFTEGTEEIASNMLGRVADSLSALVFHRRSEIEEKYDAAYAKLKAAGVGDEEAKRQASREVLQGMLEEDAMAFLGGAFSGGFMSGARLAAGGIANSISTRSDAKSLIRSNSMNSLLTQAAGLKSLDIRDRGVIENARIHMEQGTLSLREATNALKTIYKSGTQLAQDVAIDAMEQMAKEEINRVADENGLDLSDEEIGKAAAAAPAFLTEGKIVEALRDLAAKAPQVLDIFKEMSSSVTEAGRQAAERIREAQAPAQRLMDATDEAIQESRKSAVMRSREETLNKYLESQARKEEKAAKEAVAKAEKKTAGIAQLKAAGITVDENAKGFRPQGTQAKGTNTGDRGKVVFDTEEGTGSGTIVRKEGDSYVVRDADGKETKVAAADAKAADEVTGAVMSYVESRNTDDRTATDLLTVVRDFGVSSLKDVNGILAKGREMIVRGMLGESAPADSGVAPEVAEALYKAGVEQGKDAEAKRKAGAKTGILKPGEGTATYREGVNIKDFSAQKQKEAAALETIAKKIGLNLIFENDTENKGEFGRYDPVTGSVIVNLAGQHRNGLSHNLLTAAGHEITHLLENNSPEAYAELRAYVFGEMRKSGADGALRVLQKLDDYNGQISNMKEKAAANPDSAELAKYGDLELLTMDKAIAEVVADACDQVLGNEQLIGKLANDNPGLYQKMKNYVKDFILKVKAAASGLRGSGSTDSLYMRDMDELARKWGIALDEVNGKAEAGTAQNAALSTETAANTETETQAEAQTEAEAKHAEHMEQLQKEAEALPEKKQFSMEEPVERTKIGLVAVHNLDARGLMSVLGMGGFPMPSIAVVNRLKGWEDYGNISVIFDRFTADPALNPKGRLYGGDSYTPTLGRFDAQGNAQRALEYLQSQPENLYDYGGEYNTAKEYQKFASADQARDAMQRATDYHKLSKAEKVADAANVRKITDMLADLNEGNTELFYPGRTADGSTKEFRRAIHGAIQDTMTWLNMENDGKIQGVDADSLMNQFNTALMERAEAQGLNPDGINGFAEGEGLYKFFERALRMGSDTVMMEAKPDEIVGFEHVKAVIMPEGTDQAMIDALEGMGIQVLSYADGDEDLRLKTLNQFVDEYEAQEHDEGSHVQFSFRDTIKESYEDQFRKLDTKDFSGWKKSDSIVFSKSTPDIYAMAGMNKDHPITMLLSGLKKAVRTKAASTQSRHGIDIKNFKNADKSIQNPYFVIAQPSRNSAIAFTDITSEGKPVAIPIVKDVIHDNEVSNEAATAFPLRDAAEYIKDILEKDKDAYIVVNENNAATVVRKADTIPAADELLQRYYGIINKSGNEVNNKSETSENSGIESSDASGEDQQAQRSFEEGTPDAHEWIMGLDASDMNGDELGYINSAGTRKLIRTYQKGVRDIQATQQKILDMKEQLKTAKGDEARKLRINIQTETNKLDRLQKQVSDLSDGQDFGKVMQAAQTTIDSFLRGKTREEVEKNVESMKAEAKRLRQTAQGAAEDLERLAGREDAVIANRIFDPKKVEAAAGHLLELNKNHGKADLIGDRLGSIGLKILAGDSEGMQQEVGELVDYLINQDWATYRFGMFRGQRFEAKDVDPEIRDAITGEVMESVFGMLPEAAQGQGSNEINSLVKYVNSITKNTRQAGRGMQKMAQLAEALEQQSEALRKAAGNMQAELKRAIRYFDMVNEKNKAVDAAEQIEAVTRQLESKAAQRVLEEQNKWAARIENDRQLRELSNENMKSRRKINTAFTRMSKLILNETDLKNVPENMKPVARAALRMILNNDALGGKKLTGVDFQTLQKNKKTLDLIDQRDGTELNLQGVVDALGGQDDDVAVAIEEALGEIEAGIGFYNGSGKGRTAANLQGDKAALERIQKGLSTIYDVVSRSGQIFLGDKAVQTADAAYEVDTEARKKEPYREFVGGLGKMIRGIKNGTVTGNLTPEYFFKNLKNNGLGRIYNEFKGAENRYGLILRDAKTKIAGIAEKYGYSGWDTKTKRAVTLASGDTVNLTLEQMMSLVATWKREQTLGPEMSYHLEKGGFVFEEKSEKKVIGREARQQKPHRVTGADIESIRGMMTKEQLAYVDDMVGILSSDMAKIGNEASLRMYGIEKYKETYYFPFAVWNGVKNKSSASGANQVNPTNNNRAAHQSFTNRRKANAGNAVMLTDFTQTCAQHINQMATYATMGGAIEGMNRVLNFRVSEGMNDPTTATERNLESILEERYGKDAVAYIRRFMQDLNGGAVQQSGGLGQSLMSMFRKNAVGGSLSVALQQPLSYIRAATMIDPKYLIGAEAKSGARLASPKYWQGAYEEMLAHSGVAVIKDMGKFDMNFSRGAVSWLSPESQEKGLRKAYNAVEDATNKLPELMDQYTWVKMWEAVKREQAAAHPEMDAKSDEFLDLVGERFNDLMRRTQVYDSVLVKSQLMRNTDWFSRSITAFRAEPTLSLNLMIDALSNLKEKGGKKNLAAVMGTYLLSAIAQAAVKGIMGAGRNPDEKKTLAENFAYRFGMSFISEANPLSLIPGFDNIVDAFSGNDVNDNAWGMVKTFANSFNKIWNPPTGKDLNLTTGYRYLEDTVGQLTQLFTGIPAKNLMRDSRAVYNWFTGPYAKRDSSGAVMKYQLIDTLTGQDLIGAINKQLAGGKLWDSGTNAYYGRIYQAEKEGRTGDAADMKEYMILGKGKKEKDVASGIAKAAKEDAETSAAEAADWMLENGYADSTNWITEQYKKGEISDNELRDLYREHFPDKNPDSFIWNSKKEKYLDGSVSRSELEKEYRKLNPDADENAVWYAMDKLDYQKETGESPSGDYYRVHDAIAGNKAADITKQVQSVMEHGKTKAGVWSSIEGKWKETYLGMQNGSAEKVKLKDGITKALKAAGFTAEEAEKKIANWSGKKDAKKSTDVTRAMPFGQPDEYASSPATYLDHLMEMDEEGTLDQVSMSDFFDAVNGMTGTAPWSLLSDAVGEYVDYVDPDLETSVAEMMDYLYEHGYTEEDIFKVKKKSGLFPRSREKRVVADGKGVRKGAAYNPAEVHALEEGINYISQVAEGSYDAYEEAGDGTEQEIRQTFNGDLNSVDRYSGSWLPYWERGVPTWDEDAPEEAKKGLGGIEKRKKKRGTMTR